MNWFYAQNGQQAGPVADEELAHLVQSGIITPATLVWHSGLAGWQPYSSISATLPPPMGIPAAGSGGYAPVTGGLPGGMPAAGGQVVCSQCGSVFPADEVVRVGNHDVCARCKPLLLQKLQQGVANVGVFGAPSLALAGFWIRFGAALLDWLILLPFFLVVGVAFYALFGSTYMQRINADPQNFNALMGLQGGNLVLSLITRLLIGSYSAFCLSRWGGTPGKLICNLRVTRPDGQRITFLRGFGRYFSKYISWAILFGGYLFIVFDDQKRALHDYICDTRVSYK